MKGHFYNKSGLEEVELVLDKKYGLYVRPGSSDREMLQDSLKKDYSTLDCKGHVILDLGSNIGGFILKALSEGAKKVIAFEPEPYNFEVLKQNAQLAHSQYGGDVELFQEGVGETNGTFNLIINPGKNSACSGSITAKSRSNRIGVPVKVVALKEVIDEYKPTMIKMDIEGAEYGVLEAITDALSVKDLAVELHGFSKENNRLMHESFKMLKSKWKVVAFKEHIVFNNVSLITAHFSR